MFNSSTWTKAPKALSSRFGSVIFYLSSFGLRYFINRVARMKLSQLNLHGTNYTIRNQFQF
jgi:hypothetical protein